MLNTAIDQDPRALPASNSKSLSLSNNKLLSALPIDDFARLCADELRTAGKSQRTTEQRLKAHRGTIFDRDGAK